MSKIVLENSCETVEAKSFVVTKNMIGTAEKQNCIGFTYSGDQVEMKLFLSREIRDKNGVKVKALCIMNALSDTWNVKINNDLVPEVILPRSTKKDLVLIKVDNFTEITYLIELQKCTEEQIKNHIDSSKLEWTRRIWMKMYNSNKFHDAVISTSDGHNVYLHRFVLASASPVLRAVFTHGAEAGNGILHVPDIDKETIDVIVEYIYCGVTYVHNDLCEKVIFAAEKYDLKPLKYAAEKVMCQIVNAKNVLHYMKLADMLQLENLKKKCDATVATDDFIIARTYENIEDVNILKNILKNRISEKHPVMSKIVLENSCETVEAKSFVVTKNMIGTAEKQNCIGFTYSGDQVEMKLFLSREIRDKNGVKVKALCIMNALSDTWNVKINNDLVPEVILPRSTKKDLVLIKVDNFTEITYLIELQKCTEEQIKNHIDSSKLEWTRRIWMKMYNSNKFHDAVISTSDGHNVYLHRFVLASASPVLRAVFTHGAEAGNGILHVPDIDKETIDVIVEYIYCGVTYVRNDLCEKVIFAAEKYDLKPLKYAAEKVMCQIVNAKNVLHYMKLADMLQLENLKKKCDATVATDDFIIARTYENIEDVNILKNILKNRISEKQ